MVLSILVALSMVLSLSVVLSMVTIVVVPLSVVLSMVLNMLHHISLLLSPLRSHPELQETKKERNLNVHFSVFASRKITSYAAERVKKKSHNMMYSVYDVNPCVDAVDGPSGYSRRLHAV